MATKFILSKESAQLRKEATLEYYRSTKSHTSFTAKMMFSRSFAGARENGKGA